MGAFFVYILKAAICLAAFYLFYRLLLSRETFHRFNRIAVLGILILSLIIPFCEITIEKDTEVHQTVISLEQLLLMAYMQPQVVPQAETTTVSYIQVILIIYLAGIIFFLCRNIYCLIKLFLILRSGKKERLAGGTILIVHTNTRLSPFSWMKYIVISEKDMQENGREILIHELAHIRKHHSLDLLVADICIFFQWFNPAAWLLKQELQTIHEYQADETVLKEGVNAKQYQLLLIKKAAGTRLYSMANSFNHSKLKKRITMMLKEKSSPWARLKYLYVLPVAAVAITAFARPEVSSELNEISAVKVNDLTAIVETKNDEIKQEPKQDNFIEEDLTAIPAADKIENQNKTKTEAEAFFKGDTTVVDEIRNDENKVILKSKVVFNGDTMSIDNGQIIPRDNSNLEISFENGYTILKVKESVTEVPDSLDDNEDEELVHETLELGLDFMKEGEKPLLVVDDRIVTEDEFNKIQSGTVGSITVYQTKENMPKEYIDKGDNGVILINIKKPKYNYAIDPLNGKKINLNDEYYIDGRLIEDRNELNKLTPDEIQSFSFDKKDNGTIVRLTTKAAFDNMRAMDVKGNIKDKNGKPIAGASIQIVRTKESTVTDSEGNFSLNCQIDDKLDIGYDGRVTRRVTAFPIVNVILK